VHRIAIAVAYQWIFATIAATLAAGLAVYLTFKDVKPSAPPALHEPQAAANTSVRKAS
jgi:hypothetical protein